MRLSGINGYLVDYAKPADQEVHKRSLARVKLPVQWNMQDIKKKIEALPVQLKGKTQGAIPSYNGYVLRVMKDAEADVMRIINPEEAATLGPALGMVSTSMWAIKGVPSYLDKAQIIQAMADKDHGWSGWTVRPIKTLTTDRRPTCFWMVEAATEPPVRSMLMDETVLIDIVEYKQRPPTRNPAASVWFNLKIPSRSQIRPEQNHDILAGEDRSTPSNMDVDSQGARTRGKEHSHEKAEHEPKADGSEEHKKEDVIMQPTAHQRTKRKNEGGAQEANHEESPLIQRLTKQLEEEKENSRRLQETLATMQVTLKSLQESQTSMAASLAAAQAENREAREQNNALIAKLMAGPSANSAGAN